ncbi:TPA: hypothetical protein NO558_004433 [Klebsiella pneumoniae]|nr:hypothetical protein [Klebsiella pneumoniae]HCI4238394.1 hypothetical protein [Klebsiella pneumoniae]
MTVIIQDKNRVATKYSFLMSHVPGLIAATLFGNSAVPDGLRRSAISSERVLGEMQAIYPEGITLNANGGVTMTPAGGGALSARFLLPYTPEDNGETCVTLVSAVNSPTFVQVATYVGWRIMFNGAGDVQINSGSNQAVSTGAGLKLVDKGYMTPEGGLKDFVFITELREDGANLYLTASLHNARGASLASATAGVPNASLDMSSTSAYIGGSAAGATSFSKSLKHFGHLIFHRQLTDAEKITAAAQLAGYANSIGAMIE